MSVAKLWCWLQRKYVLIFELSEGFWPGHCYDYTFSDSYTIRGVVATPRNPGIVHFLLKVSTPTCSTDGSASIDMVEVVREKFTEHVMKRKDATGKDAFPLFRATLENVCGYYVWKRDK